MIGDNLSPASLNENVGVAKISGSLPHSRDNFRGLLKRDHLVWNAEVLVSDHVPEDAVEQLVIRRWKMCREILGADEHINFRGAKRSVVLAVGEQEIHTNRWLRRPENVPQSDEHPNT